MSSLVKVMISMPDSGQERDQRRCDISDQICGRSGWCLKEGGDLGSSASRAPSFCSFLPR